MVQYIFAETGLKGLLLGLAMQMLGYNAGLVCQVENSFRPHRATRRSQYNLGDLQVGIQARTSDATMSIPVGRYNGSHCRW